MTAHAVALRRLAEALALAAGLLIACVVTLTMINVAGFSANVAVRPFGGSVPGLPGYEDAVRLFIGTAALLMLPYCQLARGHVSVDLIANALSPRALERLTRATDAAMAILAAFLAVMLTSGALTYRADGVVSPVLGWPVWPFMLPGVGALAAWSLIAAVMAADPSVAIGDARRAGTEGAHPSGGTSTGGGG